MAPARKLVFERFQERYQVCDLSGVQLKFGHRVRGLYSLGEGLRELFDRIAEVKGPKWRRLRQWAFASVTNCMARGAIVPRETATALDLRFLCLAYARCQQRTDEGRST